MNLFAQKLSRLRCTYSTLLKLSKKHDQPQRLIALSRCTSSTLASSPSTVDPDDRKEPPTLPEILRENEYARNLFLNSYKYRKSVAPQTKTHAYVTNQQIIELLNEDWDQMIDDKLMSSVKKLNYNFYYSDKKLDPSLYEKIFVTLSERHLMLNNDNLMTLIRHLVPFREHLGDQVFYQKFCHQLNAECVKRFMNLPIDNMLALCDMLYEMTHLRENEYIWYAVRKLGNKPGRLEPQHLIQLLFFLNLCRKPPINMYELEYQLERYVDELSINEIGIAALGFFKTGSAIRSNSLLNRIMKKTIANVDYIDNVSIGGIAKLIRYSMQLREIRTLKELVDAVVPIEPRLTLMTLNHIAHACTRVALYHEELLDRIIKRLNNELETARIKELERLIYFFTSFNVDSSNQVYDNVLQELRTSWYTTRAHEIKQFPHVISRLLGYLSYVNVYPTDLIERIMMPEFMRRSMQYKRYNDTSREYFVLDYSLQVEVPQYKGNFLRHAVRQKMLQGYSLDFKSAESSRCNVFLIQVQQTCQDMFGTTEITVDKPLPHFTTPDIILCLDEQNRLLSCKEYLSKYEAGDIKRIIEGDRENARWIALIMGHHGVLIKGTNLPIGLLAAKIRQLSKIGYTPIIVSHIEWEKCVTQEQKCDYIKQLLSQNKPESIT